MTYDKRQPLPREFSFELIEENTSNRYKLTINKEIGRGGSCLVYSGVLVSFVGQEHVNKAVIIKEFYPKRLDSNIVRNNKKELVFDSDSTRESFELELRNFCKGQAEHIIYASDNPDKALPSLFCSGRGLGSFYAVSDSGIGKTLDKIELRDYDILTVLRIAASLCDAINAVHNGRIAYQLYLDCKPSNIFVNGENAYLFDFNTVQPKDRIRFCSYSEGWSAPEQEFNKERTGYATPDLLGFHTDIYSIAAVLFWMLTGKCPSESGFETNKNNFDWKSHVILKDSTNVMYDRQFIDELDRIMMKALEPDSKTRREDFSGRDSSIKLKREIEHLIRFASTNTSHTSRKVDSDNENTFGNTLTLGDLLNVDMIKSVNIKKVRSKVRNNDSLSVPIGINENGNIAYLDLLPNKDGPNGIFSGPKGSGKSEFIDNLLIMLALSFSPKQLKFDLLDFNRENNTYRDIDFLPHMNHLLIERSEEKILIWLSELKKEINKRTALIESKNVISIQEYNEKLSDSSQKIARIVIVIDDLRFLKIEYPNYFRELLELLDIDTCKSCGLHAVFTTDNPEGLIDDFLYKLCNFKIISNQGVPGNIWFNSFDVDLIQNIQLVCSELNDCTPKSNLQQYAWYFDVHSQKHELIKIIRDYDL